MLPGARVTACSAVVIGGTVTLALTVLLQGLEDTNLSLVRKAEDYRQAEAARQRLEAELRRSQSMELMGTLASGITHDLKNILHPILALTEMARAELEPGSHLPAAGGRARRGGTGHGSHPADPVLQPAQDGPRQLVPVEAVIDEVRRLLRPTLPSTVRIRVAMDPPLAQVEAQSIELHQVLLNLATNAAHAMRTTGGELLIRLRWVGAREIAIEVRDEGIGMDADTLARAFEPLFTTKSELEGTGLGLPMSRRIVEGLGGTLVLSSSPGQGCAAEIRLPAVPQENLADHAQPLRS